MFSGWILRRFGVMTACLAVALSVPGAVGAATGPWVVARADAAAWTFTALAWGHGRYVAATADGIIATSLDGGAWRPVAGDEEWSITDIASGPDGFVAVGRLTRTDQGRESLVLHSDDGVRWASVLPAGTEDTGLDCALWDGAAWLAYGTGVVWSSPNGVTWTEHDLVVDQGPLPRLSISGVVLWGGKLVAVGTISIMGDPQNLIQGWAGTSADGLSWTTAGLVDDRPLHGLAAGDDALAAVGKGVTARSPDGASWSFEDLAGGSVLEDVVWTGGRFVAVGGVTPQDGAARGVILTSEDGTGWSAADTGAAGDWLAAGAASLSGVLAVGPRSVAASGDGLSWERPLGDPLADVVGPMVAAAPGLVAAGDLVAPPAWLGVHRRTAWTSADGIEWSATPLPGSAGAVIDLAVRDGTVLGAGGCLSRSVVIRGADGEWTMADVAGPDGSKLHGAGAGPGRFVVSGSHGLVAASGDGTAWTTHALAGFNTTWNDVVWTGSKYIAVAGNSRMAESADGVLWSITAAGEGRAGIERLASGSGVTVGVGQPGALQVTTDGGATWFRAATPPDVHLWDVRWTGAGFIAVGGRGTVLESPDGLQWTAATTPVAVELDGAGTIDGRTVVTGRGGTIQVRLEDPPAVAEASDGRVVVPAAAHVAGFDGSFWTTDLALTNPTAHALLAWVRFLPRDGAPLTRPVVVEAASSRVFTDVVSTLFGQPGAAGSLVIDSPGGLVATSRTASPFGEGAAGQVLPGTPPAAGGDTFIFPGLAGPPGFRTNIGLANLSGSDVHCTISVRGADGAELAVPEADLGPWGSTQLNRVLRSAGAVTGAWAVGQCDGPVAAYASVVDLGTNDGATVLPAPVTDEPLVVPAVARTPGYNGSLWRSDLFLVNPHDRAARVRVDLLPEGGGIVTGPEITVAAQSETGIGDVLGTKFPGARAGALRVVSLEGSVAVWSRTYNVVGGLGTLGQGVPAVPESALSAGAGALAIGGLKGGPAAGRWFHTNLGLVNASVQDVSVTVELYRGNGRRLASTPVDLPAGSWTQLLRVFRNVAAAPVADGYALVEVPSGGAGVTAWASVIDDRSGDPSFEIGQAKAGRAP